MKKRPLPRPWLAVTGLMLFMVACGISPAEEADSACDTTMPSLPGFVPPEPYAATPSIPDAVWYGTADLWTVLSADGSYQPRKSVWWSDRFGGGKVEEVPPITVSHYRLDEAATSPQVETPGTNAYTVEDGWFMMAGIDPQTPGCWQVTAEYKGATLSYVYEIPPGG